MTHSSVKLSVVILYFLFVMQQEDLSHADINVDACCSWSQYGQIPDKNSLMSTSHFDYKHKRPGFQQIWMRDEKSQDIEVNNISHHSLLRPYYN